MYTVVEFDLRVDRNGLLDDEAQFHCGPSKYERSQKRVETFRDLESFRLHTKAGELVFFSFTIVDLTFGLQIFERIKICETSGKGLLQTFHC